MKSLDARKMHPVTVTFLLDEEVAPQLFVQKLAAACGGGVLSPGEAIRVDHAKIACVITDETLSLPHFGWQWRKSLKNPKHPKITRNRCR
jgi:hypothetical protein